MKKSIYDVVLDTKDAITSNKYQEEVGLASVAASVDYNLDSSFEDFSAALAPVEDTDNNIAKEAGALAAAAALDVTVIDQQSLPTGGESVNLNSVDGMLRADKLEVTSEAFTGKDPENLASVSYGYNYGVLTAQNAFAEAFFPTVLKPVGTAGVKVTADVDFIMQPFTRSDGKAVEGKSKMVPLIKTLGDSNGAFGSNKLALTPVSDRDSDLDVYFVKTLETDGKDEATGVAIKTAPLKGGTRIPLLDLCQTADALARGVMDHTDSLDPAVKVTDIFVDVEGEAYDFGVGAFAGSTFTITPEGDGLDIQLSVVNPNFTVDPSKLTVYPSGAAATKFPDTPAGYKFVYELVLTGRGNVADGEISVYLSEITFKKILDASGNELPTTDANYAAIKANADKITPAGYKGFFVDANLVNDNLRRLGHLITRREKASIYPLKPLSPFTVNSPVSGYAGIKSDARVIPSLIKNTIHEINNNAVVTIKKFIDQLATYVNSGGDMSNLQVAGIGRYLVNGFFKSIPLNLADAVDSISSGNRKKDVRAALEMKISEIANQALTDSNYTYAMIGEGGFEVIVGTDLRIGAFLGDTVNIGNGITARVVSVDHDDVAGKIWVTVTKGKTPDVEPLSFGNFVYVPALVADTISGTGNASVRQYQVQPICAHIINLPIIGELVVSGIEAMSAKVTVNVSK